MFDLERFQEDCLSALKEKSPHAAVKEIVARAVAEPGHVVSTLGEPKLAGLESLYRSDQLTILNVLWGPGMTLYPHDHRMWAVIGVYTGQEENAFYLRGESRLIGHGNKTLRTKDALPLGESVIHAVTNPLETITAAISSRFRAANGTRRHWKNVRSILKTRSEFSRNRISAF